LIKPFLALGSHAYLAKMLSLMSGFGSLILAYHLLKQHVNSSSFIILGLLFVSFLPEFVSQSIEVRQYSLALVFVWSSLICYFNMKTRDFLRFQDHVFFALITGLSLFTEYGIISHSLILCGLIYIPLGIRLIRKHQWKNISYLFSPIMFVFIMIGLVYFSQYGT